MDTRQTCGYDGHCCGTNRVQFISRYHETNDYCVDGRRISVTDDGRVHESFRPVDAPTVERIRLFELGKYADYIAFHIELKSQNPQCEIPLQPFGFAA